MARQQLQDKLLELAPYAWFQKPPNNQMRYPCFVYKAVEPETVCAGNKTYMLMPRYEILYITYAENDEIWDLMTQKFEYCSVGRKYVADGLYHYPFTVNYR